MRTAHRTIPSFVPALLCMGAFLLCMLLIWPVVESGVMDDWSYIRTAQLLAETGHIHYNGWATAMLGWPLYVAALFIKIFGFSFTITRITVILEALAAIALVQQTFLLTGISQWNASLGTLTLAVCPLFVLASASFMSDIPGLLAIMVCLYACLRALRSTASRSASAWICFAALSNAVLGTSRQIAWLGLLVIVPCGMWLLRRCRDVVWLGSAAWIVGVTFMVLSMHWFAAQPYTLPEPLVRGHADLHAVKKLCEVLVSISLDLCLLLIPITLAFVRSFKGLRRPVIVALGILGIAVLSLAFVLHQKHTLKFCLSPFLLYQNIHPQTAENTFASTAMPLKGPAPLPLSSGFQLGLTIVALLAAASLIAAIFNRSRSHIGAPVQTGEISWFQLLVMTVPLLIAYVGLLLPRAVFFFAFDRYLLLLLPPLLLLLLRFYEANIGARLPVGSVILIAVVAIYSITTTHDFFSCFRASLEAISELRARGIPRSEIDGGWEYDHDTQIRETGYVHQPGITLPGGGRLRYAPGTAETPCSMLADDQTPDVHPLYAISYSGGPCAPVSGFLPVHFLTWLPPFHREVIIVHYVMGNPNPAAS